MRQYYYSYLDRTIRFSRPSILLKNTIGDLEDIQETFTQLSKKAKPEDRLMVTYYNHLWEPILKLASWLGWRKRIDEQNWVSNQDLVNLLSLSGWETISHRTRLLLPVYIPFISNFVNSVVAPLPIINSFCLLTWAIARPKQTTRKEYSVSIIVAARNEEKNISKIVPSIPKFGKWQEVVFVEGHSRDNTWAEIQKVVSKKNRIKVQAHRQKGTGKGDAVRLGFDVAKGELLMILDADLTVNPKDLPKFYEVLASGVGEFVNGSRLVYPMEREAMQTLNKIGNVLFGLLFSWILGQRFTDTLCGTKVVLANDYQRIKKGRHFFGNFDPFGDFDLIFGAVKQNLKVIEVPVRYRERRYGTTNISRFKHGWLLIKMTWFAFQKFML